MEEMSAEFQERNEQTEEYELETEFTMGGGGTIIVDNKSINFNTNNATQIKGYQEAPEGFMPVKSEDGIEWKKAADETKLDEAVAAAEAARDQAGIYATSAGTSATEAGQAKDYVERKFFSGSKEYYKQLIEQGILREDSIFMVQTGIVADE